MFSAATTRSEAMDRVISPVAFISTDFDEKFGIPRQSCLVKESEGVIHFVGKYNDKAAIKGLEDFSHLWLLWDFSESPAGQSLTVCPPRLGGKVKKGVFATRSPYRPNGIGLSCVKLEKIVYAGDGPELHVSGVDMLDGTPIFDIKPYMPYSDCFPEADGGFGQENSDFRIKVDFPEELLEKIPADKRLAVLHILEQDPRAAYNKESGYVYGLSYAGYDIRFQASEERIVVIDVINKPGDFEKIK